MCTERVCHERVCHERVWYARVVFEKGVMKRERTMARVMMMPGLIYRVTTEGGHLLCKGKTPRRFQFSLVRIAPPQIDSRRSGCLDTVSDLRWSLRGATDGPRSKSRSRSQCSPAPGCQYCYQGRGRGRGRVGLGWVRGEVR